MNVASAYKDSCIYCGSEGPFTDEHMISAGLGGDDDVFVLRNCVCSDCNTIIFSPLEREMLRCSPLAIGRVFMQPSSRKRGKNTGIPKLEAKTKVVLTESGRWVEFEFGRHAKPTLLPQLNLVGENSVEATSDTAQQLVEFVEALHRLFDKPIVCIRKLISEGKPTFELSQILWETDGYVEIGEPAYVAKPPTSGVWLERIEGANDESKSSHARLFQSQAKSIVLKLSDKMSPEASLRLFRKSVAQVDFSTAKESTITNPLVSVGMTMTLGVTDRVLAKIGINILAYVAGADYVRHPGFDEIKKSILTGLPGIQLESLQEAKQMEEILSWIPAGNHLFFISGIHLPTGEYALGMTMKLYGTSQFIKLGINVPELFALMPIIFTAEYTTHIVKQWSPIEFAKLLVPLARSMKT
jgi:hypothetical protein